MPGFLSPGKGMPLLLIPEYLGINKGQRVPDRSKTAHRKPLVKCFLTAEDIMINAVLDEAQARIKIARRTFNKLRYTDDTTLMTESEEELKSILMKVKEENGKVGLKFSIQKTKIMAFDPITWQIDGETMETVRTFIFLGSKITSDGDCSQEIKRHLLLGRKVITKLDSISKRRDITLPTKVRLVKAMVFTVVVHESESCSIRIAEP